MAIVDAAVLDLAVSIRSDKAKYILQLSPDDFNLLRGNTFQ
jgi:hypothetical protein